MAFCVYVRVCVIVTATWVNSLCVSVQDAQTTQSILKL
jgi:hypothetical protein